MKLIDGSFKYGETVAIDADGKLYKCKVSYDLESGEYVTINGNRIYAADLEKKQFNHNAYMVKYIREKRDRITVSIPKTQGETWRQYAADLDMSMNAFIIYCVEKEIHE